MAELLKKGTVLFVVFLGGLTLAAAATGRMSPRAECPGLALVADGFWAAGPNTGEPTPGGAVREFIEDSLGSKFVREGQTLEVLDRAPGLKVAVHRIGGQTVAIFELTETEFGRFIVDREIYCLDENEQPLADYEGAFFRDMFADHSESVTFVDVNGENVPLEDR